MLDSGSESAGRGAFPVSLNKGHEAFWKSSLKQKRVIQEFLCCCSL